MWRKIRRMLAANWHPDEPGLGPAMGDLERLERFARAGPRGEDFSGLLLAVSSG